MWMNYWIKTQALQWICIAIPRSTLNRINMGYHARETESGVEVENKGDLRWLKGFGVNAKMKTSGGNR